jgi:hypothetical protein
MAVIPELDQGINMGVSCSRSLCSAEAPHTGGVERRGASRCARPATGYLWAMSLHAAALSKSCSLNTARETACRYSLPAKPTILNSSVNPGAVRKS